MRIVSQGRILITSQMACCHFRSEMMTENAFRFYRSLSDQERSKSLQELEGQDWGEGNYFPSHLVRTTHALRRKPLRDFTIEDLRIMIGQHIGLNYLVPLAVEQLQHDPLATCDFY